MFEKTRDAAGSNEAMNIDRRVARTRTALFDALVALLLRKDYDEIGIQEILDEADVSRSSFYAHFTSKDDLLERSLERLRSLLVQGRHNILQARTKDVDAAWDYSLAFFEHVAEYKRVYYAAAGKHAGAIILGALHDVLVDFLRHSSKLPTPEGVPRDLIAEYLAGTLLVVMRWWLDRKPSLTASEVNTIFCKLVAIPIEPTFLGS